MTDDITPPAAARDPADNSKMARATAGISTFAVLGFLTGPVIKMILSRRLGTGPAANAYNFAYRLTQDVFRSWEKLIRPTYLPVLAREREHVGDEDAWRFTSTIVNVQAILLAVITLVLMVFSRQVVGLFSFPAEEASLSMRFLVVLAPALFFLSLAVTGYMLLNSYKRFHLAAFGDQLFVKLVPLGALVALYWLLGIHALLLGIVFGAAAKLGLYIWGLRGEIRHYRFRLALASPAMKSVGLLMLPLLVGVAVSFARNRVEDTFLTAVRQGRAMTIVTYAKAPVDIPIQLFPVAMSIAIFPFISDYFAKKQLAELFAVLGKGVRIIFLAFLPLTVGLVILAHPLIDVAFGGGKFGAEDVLLTSRTLRFYAIGYVFFGLEILLLQFFYAARDTWRPTYIGVITSIVQLFILSWLITLKGDDVGAFTLAYSVSKTVKVFILIALLVSVYPHAKLWLGMLRRTGLAFLKIAAVTVVMGVIVYFLSEALKPHLATAKTITGLAHLVVAAGVGGVIFVAGVHLLRVEEWRQAVDWVKRKLNR